MHIASDCTGQRGDVVGEVVEVAQNAGGVLVEAPSNHGRHYTRRQPVEQPYAKRHLQVFDLHGEAGLRRMLAPGGRCERALLVDSNEITDLLQLQVVQHDTDGDQLF